jgi:hypothetical protein
MSLTSTPAYVATVGEDHTIVLPEEIPIGAKVTITVIPSSVPNQHDDEARRARFEETLAAIRTASTAEIIGSAISDAELDALIKRARKAPRGE